MIKRLNEIKISFKHSVEGEIKKDEMIKSNKVKQFFATKENSSIETKEAKINMLNSYQGKFELHNQKSEPNEIRRKSLHNTPKLSIVENSHSNINDKVMTIPLSHTPNLRKFKPNNKKDKIINTKIKKINPNDKNRNNSIKKNDFDIIKKRRGTVKEKDSINIKKLLNSEINIQGNQTEVNNIIFSDNISEILIGENNNNKLIRGNTKRRNTVNVAPSDAQIKKLKSKFAPSGL